MKKMIVTCVLLGSAVATAFSQHIELKGVVREAKTNEVLAFVNVVLQTPDSAFVTGAVSDDNGKFAIPNLNPGDYRLALSFMGYKTLYIEVAGLT
ncbi:MAG: carboxypeptidase-like regulatory domain-containing protein, partial [Tannerella sp.]|nr:carboxypeptidase-like regulatory domain-containing protein [Tannerella sp.]